MAAFLSFSQYVNAVLCLINQFLISEWVMFTQDNLFDVVNPMASDVLTIQGARASAAMMLTYM